MSAKLQSMNVKTCYNIIRKGSTQKIKIIEERKNENVTIQVAEIVIILTKPESYEVSNTSKCNIMTKDQTKMPKVD